MRIGIKSMSKDLGFEVEVQVNTGSSVAKSISSRLGAGRVRHVEVRELWVQRSVHRVELSIINVRGEDNVADGLAKHVERNNMEMYIEKCGSVKRQRRHEICPYVGSV